MYFYQILLTLCQHGKHSQILLGVCREAHFCKITLKILQRKITPLDVSGLFINQIKYILSAFIFCNMANDSFEKRLQFIIYYDALRNKISENG